MRGLQRELPVQTGHPSRGHPYRLVAVALLVCLATLAGARSATTASSTPVHHSSHPSQRGLTGASAVEQIAPSADGKGYWMVAADGGVAAFGDAVGYGSVTALSLGSHIVGMAPTHDDKGYWLVGADGGIFAFGDAGYYGSTGSLTLNKPIVGMTPTADGRGYWLVASDGGLFAFGDAPFHGSTGSLTLNRPVVGMAPTADGGGYWLVASDGGIFAFGDAAFPGSMGGSPLAAPVVGMASTADGGGYWMVGSDGGLFAFGDAAFYGSLIAPDPSTPGAAAPGSVAPVLTVADPTVSLPPTPDFLDVCYPHTTGTACTDEEVTATDAARAQEGLGPIRLPGDFSVLTPAEQLFVLTDIDRVDRGLPPIVGLDPTLSADAEAGAVAGTDPTPTQVPAGMGLVAWGSNWAENGNPLGSEYYWMYDDGEGGGNIDCTASDTTGCWGHRDNILGLSADQATYGGTLLMGAAEDDGTSHGGWASDAEVIVLASGPLSSLDYTWADAVAAGAS